MVNGLTLAAVLLVIPCATTTMPTTSREVVNRFFEVYSAWSPHLEKRLSLTDLPYVFLSSSRTTAGLVVTGADDLASDVARLCPDKSVNYYWDDSVTERFVAMALPAGSETKSGQKFEIRCVLVKVDATPPMVVEGAAEVVAQDQYLASLEEFFLKKHMTEEHPEEAEMDAPPQGRMANTNPSLLGPRSNDGENDLDTDTKEEASKEVVTVDRERTKVGGAKIMKVEEEESAEAESHTTDVTMIAVYVITVVIVLACVLAYFLLKNDAKNWKKLRQRGQQRRDVEVGQEANGDL